MQSMKQYKRLTTTEREEIFLLLNQGVSIREIGRRLGRDHGALSREVNQNALKRGGYSSALADFRAKKERTKPRRTLDEGVLKHYVISKLGDHWSPEQIAGRLRRISPRTRISYETIYRFIYSKEGKKNRYFEFLRKGHSGLVLLDKLGSKISKERMMPLLKRFDRYPNSLHKTITFDNGTENVDHELLAKYVNCQTYFAHPHHSWEKGTVENTIGLIREFVPKGTDLAQVKQKDLNTIALVLNDRPRKRLGFKTPSEVTSEETGWCITS